MFAVKGLYWFTLKGGILVAKDISAKETSQKKRARFYEENV
jgi:hypothetical protein